MDEQQQMMQQLAQGLIEQDPEAIKVYNQLPPEAKQMVDQMVQQMQQGGGGQQEQLMQLAQALIAGDPKAMEMFKQLDPNMQQVVQQMVQQLQQGGGEQTMAGQEQNAGPMQMKKGGWIQKAVNPKHRGYCTPMTKSTCTPRRKALARTFKKMAKNK